MKTIYICIGGPVGLQESLSAFSRELPGVPVGPWVPNLSKRTSFFISGLLGKWSQFGFLNCRNFESFCLQSSRFTKGNSKKKNERNWRFWHLERSREIYIDRLPRSKISNERLNCGCPQRGPVRCPHYRTPTLPQPYFQFLFSTSSLSVKWWGEVLV